MNQILYVSGKKKYKTIYEIELYISIIAVFASLLYMFYMNIQENNRKKIAQSIVQPYAISKLYASANIEYTETNLNTPYIMGVLEISSIDLLLPVISETTDDLLKISACRFYGPKYISPRKHLYCRA